MLTLTETARDVVREMVEAGGAPDGSGIRISADDGGDGLSLSLVAGPAEGDQVVEEDDGTRVFLEPRAASLLDDKILDADRHEDHVHFTLDEQG